MVIALVQVLVAAAAALAQPQSPIAPVRVEPPGGGTPVVISVTGVEQDPVPLAAKWNPSEACLGDIACFVANWLEANSTGSMEHVLALRAPAERAEVEKRYASDPQMMTRNAARFKEIRRWSLLGWAEYGAFRIVFLVFEDAQAQQNIYTLPIRRVEARWGQTDALATDTGVYQIFDRVGKVILERHRKK
jgi:hypothetical protein